LATGGLGLGVGEAGPDGQVQIQALARIRRDDGGRGDDRLVAGGDALGGAARQRGAGRDQRAIRLVEGEPAAGGGDGDAGVMDEGVVPLAQAEDVVEPGLAAVGPAWMTTW
jgi:hypothetical protein